MLKRFAFVLSFLFLIPFNVYAVDNSAASAIVMDCDTGIILYEKNAYQERSVASTTKIMTALLAVESKRLDQTVKITKEMINVEGSSLGLKENDELTLYDLTCGMMLTSGNDSANAVACFISGSVESFSVLMNKRAEELKMKNTFFVTPSGLDEGNHHSTAYDMALLTAFAVKNKTFCDIVSKQSAQITVNNQKRTVYNHNRLLAMDSSIFGVKTGFTKKAGRCLVSAESYNGSKLVCVTLSCPDDWNDHINLLNECEKKYKKISVSQSIDIACVGAEHDTVKCSYSGEYSLLEEPVIKEYYYPFVYAPLKKGDTVGTAEIYCRDILIERLPIEADEDVNYAKQQFSTTSKVYG